MEEQKNFNNDFIFKICVIGDGAVGKTSLIKRFTEGSFNQDYIKTLGAQFSRYERVIKDLPEADGHDVKARLFFWDIAGQKDFDFMRPTFYNGAKAAIVVYDLTNEETLNHVADWIDDISKYCGILPYVCFGNKADLLEGDYDESKIREIMKEKNILKFYKTSAKTGENVHDAFNYIINLLVSEALKSQKKK